MLKTLRCPVRVVWVYRKTQWVEFFSTGLALSVKEIIEYYGKGGRSSLASKSSNGISIVPKPRPGIQML
jgi:hypothetical protein